MSSSNNPKGMKKSGRSRKKINHSRYEDSEDDENFIEEEIPVKKNSRAQQQQYNNNNYNNNGDPHYQEDQYPQEDQGQEVYCVCRQPSYGEMVACDHPSCEYEWFHFPCVGLTIAPIGEWYCSQCSDRMRGQQGSGPHGPIVSGPHGHGPMHSGQGGPGRYNPNNLPMGHVPPQHVNYMGSHGPPGQVSVPSYQYSQAPSPLAPNPNLNRLPVNVNGPPMGGPVNGPGPLHLNHLNQHYPMIHPQYNNPGSVPPHNPSNNLPPNIPYSHGPPVQHHNPSSNPSYYMNGYQHPMSSASAPSNQGQGQGQGFIQGAPAPPPSSGPGPTGPVPLPSSASQNESAPPSVSLPLSSSSGIAPSSSPVTNVSGAVGAVQSSPSPSSPAQNAPIAAPANLEASNVNIPSQTSDSNTTA